MTATHSSPIEQNWSVQSAKQDELRPGAAAATASARELNDELGHWTVVELRDYQAELVLAVISLAAAGDQPWSIGADEPTVALLRLSARLALRRPSASSEAASQVVELLRLKRLGGL